MRPLTIFARKTLLGGLKPKTILNFRNFTSSAFHLEVLKETTIPRDVIQARILEVLKSYEKIDAKLISPEAHFAKDLKLDSLDAVEVVMAIEEEFSIEIPDHDADEIKSVTAAIEYVASRSDAH